jgi:superfamily II DNA or RNA helicase
VNATLASDRFQEIIGRIKDSGTFLFVGDECHHHGSIRYSRALPENAGMRLGLSATYERHGDPDGTARLESYYGNVAYTFTLSDAIDKGLLVPYRYNLVLVELTDSEDDVYSEIARRISERLRVLKSESKDIQFDDPIIKSLLLRRARFLGSLASKRQKLAELIDEVDLPPRTLIYCGEGRSLIDEDETDEGVPPDDLQNIDLITRMISDKGYRVSKFTSQEPADERREILSMFRTGNIEVLTAIRCLDEGINIPACETAFILASSSNPRQFIQRRGRILRRSPGKLSATLWDFLALPSSSSTSEDHEKQILGRELTRISEFSRHSLNFRETYDLLSPLLEKYDLGPDFLLGGPETKPVTIETSGQNS